MELYMALPCQETTMHPGDLIYYSEQRTTGVDLVKKSMKYDVRAFFSQWKFDLFYPSVGGFSWL